VASSTRSYLAAAGIEEIGVAQRDAVEAVRA